MRAQDLRSINYYAISSMYLSCRALYSVSMNNKEPRAMTLYTVRITIAGETTSYCDIEALTPWRALGEVACVCEPYISEYRLANIKHADGTHHITFNDGTCVSARLAL